MTTPYPSIVLVQGAPFEKTDGEYDMQFLSLKDSAGNWYYTTKQDKAHVFPDLKAASIAIREYRNSYGEHSNLTAVTADSEWTRPKRRGFLHAWQIRSPIEFQHNWLNGDPYP